MKPFPTTLDFALTGRCNLRCKHCNTSSTWDLKEELSFGEIIDILEQLKKEKVFFLNLFGGEPFYHSRIYEIFEALSNYPMRIEILTNGTLIDEEAIRHIKKLKYLSNVQVSIDGSCPEVHDWQRGEGSFEKAMRGIKLLMKNNVSVTMKAIINSHNYKDMENMLKLSIDLGLGGMSFGDAVECGRAAKYAGDMKFEGQAQSFIMNEIFRFRKEYPGVFIGGTLAQKADMLKDFYVNGPGKGTRGKFSTCPAGQSMLSIRSDGKVVPCSAFWTLVCGDLKKESLRNIWENSSILNQIRDLSEEELTKYRPECKECDYLSYCNGGCRASAYYSSGENLKGFEEAECLVFSNLYGYRLEKEKVVPVKEKV